MSHTWALGALTRLAAAPLAAQPGTPSGRTVVRVLVDGDGARYDAARVRRGRERERKTGRRVRGSDRSHGWRLLRRNRVPAQSFLFRPGLATWSFKVQRRIQRLLETDRWASPVRDYKITTTFRAGRLTGLPAFEFGCGRRVSLRGGCSG